MPRCDVRPPRLYLDAPLDEGASIALDASQANYLGNVLRLKAGDCVLIFNGRDGEWRGTLASAGKRRLPPPLRAPTPPPNPPPCPPFLFPPPQQARPPLLGLKAGAAGASPLPPRPPPPAPDA